MIKYDVTVEEFSGDITRTTWKVEGKRHRLDGPAIEDSDGYKAYYVEGTELSEEEFLLKTQPIKKMTVSEIEEKFGFKVEIISEQEIK